MIKIDKILFPSDLTAYSTAGLEYALTLSRLYDAKLYILHILDTSMFEEITGNIPETDEMYLSLEENKRIEMNKYIRENLKENSKVFQALKFGKVSDEIIKFAEDENIDLIIMEETGLRSKESSAFMGTVEKVITGTNISVLNINGLSTETKPHYSSLADSKLQLNTFGRALFN